MTAPENENGSITHRGPVSGVTVHAHMRSGPHSLMEYPLDLTLATELMFLFAEQARRGTSVEPLSITPRSVLEHLQSIGVRSGNGSRTVGRDAVYESFARLRTKGYIRRTFGADPETGQRTGVAYEFYDWPAWNPDAPAIAETPTDGTSQQVTPTSGIAGSGDAGSRTRKRTNKRSMQVGATSGNAGSPPLPPGGGGTTPPPNPLTGNTDGAMPHPQHPEDGEVSFEPSDLEAAAQFLQQLPDPWEIGEQDARDMAPELLTFMHRQSWPQFADVDLKALAACLTTNPGGANNLPSILRRRRIPNLPAYSRVAARAARRSNAPAEGMCARHPGFREDDCPRCLKAEQERTQRLASEPAPINGAALLASLLSQNTN